MLIHQLQLVSSQMANLFRTLFHTTGDTISTSLTTGEVSPFGDLTSTSGGTATNLAGTVDNHVITVTAGSAGTTATGQYVTTVTVD